MNEILIHVTIWRNFENVMLSEKRQTQKPITMKCPKGKAMETHGRTVVA